MAEKYVADQYYIPADAEGPWLIVTICEQTGTVDVQSDHGDYQHRWPRQCLAKGSSLKRFLCEEHGWTRTHFDYFQDKFGYPSSGRGQAGNWFDATETVKRIKADIMKKRRNPAKVLRLGKDEARELYDMARNLDDDDLSRDSFWHAFPQELLDRIYDGDYASVPWVQGSHPQLVQFMKRCWPRFVRIIAREEQETLLVPYNIRFKCWAVATGWLGSDNTRAYVVWNDRHWVEFGREHEVPHYHQPLGAASYLDGECMSFRDVECSMGEKCHEMYNVWLAKKYNVEYINKQIAKTSEGDQVL